MLILLLLFFLVVRCCSVGSDFALGIFINATLAATLLARFQLIYVGVKLLSGIGQVNRMGSTMSQIVFVAYHSILLFLMNLIDLFFIINIMTLRRCHITQ